MCDGPLSLVAFYVRHQAKVDTPQLQSFEPQHQHYNVLLPMIQICARATIRSHKLSAPAICLSTQWLARRQFSGTSWRKEDPRIESMGREITDEFAVIRDEYGKCLS